MLSLIVLDGCATVQLTHGFNTLVDEDDWPQLCGISFRVHKLRCHTYAITSRRVGRKVSGIGLHRIVVWAAKGQFVDHINGDGLDNRRCNLRACSPSENLQNIRKTHGRSRYKGVIWESNRGVWAARIKSPTARKRLGCFATEVEAARAYDAAAREMFGSFACTNADIYGEY